MKFDRKAPGEGVEAICRLENGKALLEWRFRWAEEPETGDQAGPGQPGTAKEEGRTREGWMVRVVLRDREGNVAVECMQALGEEEPLESVLVQPGLWQGIKEPWLYHGEAVLVKNGLCADRLSFSLPLRTARTGQGGEFLLNETPVALRAVAYSVPCIGSSARRQKQVQEDLRCMLHIGANCVWVEEKELSADFLRLCDRLGLLAFAKAEDGSGVYCPWDKSVRLSGAEEKREEMPVFRGRTNAFFRPEGEYPQALFYKYKARWSREPFVYIVPESLKRQRSGNYNVTCYSNCGRLALYSDGTLFEFRQGEGEFSFSEVPARAPCIMLSAEGEGCSSALSIHKSFLKILENSGERGVES